MFQPYDEKTAGPKDRIAWALCQIIDDDAPLRWTRYRFAAECIAGNGKLMADLQAVAGPSAEIARLQAQVAESKQRSDALLASGCEKIESLQAQVDALAEALRDAVAMIDSLNSAYGAAGPDRVAKACRAALAAAGR